MSFAGAQSLCPHDEWRVVHSVERMVQQDIQAAINRNITYITKYRLAEPKPDPVRTTLAILPNLLLAWLLIWLERLLPDRR